MNKNIQTIAKILLWALLLSLLASCTRDDDDEDFINPRDRYLGTWLCKDADGASYRATISSDPSHSSYVIIKNFYDYKGTVRALVSSETITVSNQEMVMPAGVIGTYWCEGIGSLTKKSGTFIIDWRKYAANEDETTSIYTKE
ncbi:MAG: hypothetical protein FWF09_04295 [Bacteroidales bacterium]|nr:hypothetical protein [Bacteroidales bacterium]